MAAAAVVVVVVVLALWLQRKSYACFCVLVPGEEEAVPALWKQRKSCACSCPVTKHTRART